LSPSALSNLFVINANLALIWHNDSTKALSFNSLTSAFNSETSFFIILKSFNSANKLLTSAVTSLHHSGSCLVNPGFKNHTV